MAERNHKMVGIRRILELEVEAVSLTGTYQTLALKYMALYNHSYQLQKQMQWKFV